MQDSGGAVLFINQNVVLRDMFANFLFEIIVQLEKELELA